MTLQHSGGLPVGYAKGAYPQSGYKVLGLIFKEYFVVGFLWGFWVVFGIWWGWGWDY